MSKRTKENKRKSFLRKAQARERVGSYYIQYRESSKAGVEYQNTRPKRGFRLPKIINLHFQGLLDYLLGKRKESAVGTFSKPYGVGGI